VANPWIEDSKGTEQTTATTILQPLFQDNLGKPLPEKVKPVWIYMRQEMMGFRNGSGISWTIYKQSAPRSREITRPTPHHSVSAGWMLLLSPNQPKKLFAKLTVKR